MQITAIQVYPLSYIREYPTPFTRSFALVEVMTDAGVSGWGEASDCFGHSDPLVIQQVIQEELVRHFVGRDPLAPEQVVQSFRQWVYQTMGWAGAVLQALSAVEIALWDIRGKIKNEPIHRLLGSYRDRVAVYAAGTIAFDQPPEWHVRFFQPLLERGVTAAKLRMGKSLKWDVDLIKGVRKILGADVNLIADGKYNYTLPTAQRLVRQLQDYDLMYLEEPLPEYDLNAMAMLAASTDIPLAYGEHTYTVHGFREHIEHRTARVFQPDATIVGGLSEARKVATLAEAWSIPLSPHCGGLTAVGMAANIHLSAAAPTFTVLEYDASPFQPLRDELLKDALFSSERIEAGCLQVPNAPGLGIEVNKAVLEKYRYRPRDSKIDTPPSYGTPHL